MGIAASLALCRSAWNTTLVVHDRTSADVTRSDGELKAFAPVQRYQIPSSMTVTHVDDAAVVDERLHGSELLCVCVPSSSVADVAPLLSKLGTANINPSPSSHSSAVVVFSRGLTSKGISPQELLQQEVQKLARRDMAVVTATGPMFAKDWASAQTTADVSPLTLGLSRRTSDTSLFDGHNAPTCLVADSSSSSGGLALSERAALVERQIGYVNALSLLASVGAGIVSNQYPGNISAQASYHLHCQLATQHLVEQLLPLQADDGSWTTASAASAPHATLSALSSSTITSACYNLASREFAYGRMLDFNFRRKDAVNAHFSPSSAHQRSLDETCDGIFSLMEKKGVHSPFYTTLCDAYLCVVRGSTAGKYLVRPLDFSWLEELQKPPAIVKEMSVLDEAVAADDLKGFDAAKQKLAEAMSHSP